MQHAMPRGIGPFCVSLAVLRAVIGHSNKRRIRRSITLLMPNLLLR
jgi:hypothetical protein